MEGGILSRCIEASWVVQLATMNLLALFMLPLRPKRIPTWDSKPEIIHFASLKKRLRPNLQASKNLTDDETLFCRSLGVRRSLLRHV
jgi:hypothetical protein